MVENSQTQGQNQSIRNKENNIKNQQNQDSRIGKRYSLTLHAILDIMSNI